MGRGTQFCHCERSVAISFINFDALLKGDSRGKGKFAGERDCFPSPSLFPRAPVTLKTPHIPLAPYSLRGVYKRIATKNE